MPSRVAIAPAEVVCRFFTVLGRWNWKNPVVLCSIVDEKNEPGLMGFKVWNPKVRYGYT